MTWNRVRIAPQGLARAVLRAAVASAPLGVNNALTDYSMWQGLPHPSAMRYRTAVILSSAAKFHLLRHATS